jgi:hypothetical protein
MDRSDAHDARDTVRRAGCRRARSARRVHLLRTAKRRAADRDPAQHRGGRAAARAGGVPTAALGVLHHFTIAFIIAATYVVASRLLPVLRKRWVVCGLAFGVLAYFVMTFIVVPLSNAGPGRLTFALPVAPVLINGLAIHAFGVGLPAAFFASRVRS